jgi:hypothetical protein
VCLLGLVGLAGGACVLVCTGATRTMAGDNTCPACVRL